MLSLFVFILLNQVKLLLLCQTDWFWLYPETESFHHSVLGICIDFLELIILLG